MKTITQKQLKCFFAAYPPKPPRTFALERRLKIGTGFHNKWYSSQREHWLGWLLAKDCEARAKGVDPSEIDAEVRWRHLMCSPAMFWVAECAGVASASLDKAEDAASVAAKANFKDGHPHGKLLRKVLPWGMVSEAILSGPEPVPSDFAEEEAELAFKCLCAKQSRFMKLRSWM